MPRVSAVWLFPILITILMVVSVISIGVGAVDITPRQVIAIIGNHFGLNIDVVYTQQQDAVVWSIRLPRVLLGILVGASLAASGAALQGLFRNPLADPGLIGVSSGAALGAVIALGLGINWFGLVTTPIFAFVGGFITAMLAYGIARHNGRTEVVTLVLAGIALNTFAGAGTSLVTFVANDAQLRAIIFWSLGSLGSATWQSLATVTPFILLGLAFSLRWGGPLNLLTLGEREARHLGLETERFRFMVVFFTSLMTGASVAAAGIIGFVGLIIPHVMRMICGPDHRILVPASALGGAILLVSADMVARTIVAPLELPLGVLTALIGGPFLLFLMLRARNQVGGWG